jgi:hypothetical protein
MTGRAAGTCAGTGMPGFVNPFFGRGFGGGGSGRRNMFRATGQPGWMRYAFAPAPFAPAPEAEKNILKSQAEALQARLEEIRSRLAELEAEKAGK